MNYEVVIGNEYTCPVCNKQFTAGHDTKYIVKGGYTCSWKCFLDRVKQHEAEKKLEQTTPKPTIPKPINPIASAIPVTDIKQLPEKKRRGRPPKIKTEAIVISAPVVVAKKRGRPPKVQTQEVHTSNKVELF